MKKNDNTSDLVIEGLVDYLVQTGQKDLLPLVATKLDDLTGQTKQASQVVVTSFVPLDRSQLMKIGRLVRKAAAIDLPVTNVVDKKLLGGFTARVGDWFLDASLARELDAIRDLLLS